MSQGMYSACIPFNLLMKWKESLNAIMWCALLLQTRFYFWQLANLNEFIALDTIDKISAICTQMLIYKQFADLSVWLYCLQCSLCLSYPSNKPTLDMAFHHNAILNAFVLTDFCFLFQGVS